jgi:hypothetical protein
LGSTVTLNENVDGEVSIWVRVSDGVNWSPAYEAKITVNGINDSPVVFDWQQTYIQGESFSPIHFRTGMQFDPEAQKNTSLLDSFSYQFVDKTNSTNAKTPNGEIQQVAGQANGIFVYVPNVDFVGTDVVSFWVTDEQGLQSEKGNITYHVIGNQPLIVGQSTLGIQEGNSITLLVNNFTITDPDSAVFTLYVQDGENYTHNGNEILPNSGYSGVLIVPIIVSDGSNYSPVFEAKIHTDKIPGKILSIQTDLLGTSVSETNTNGN